MPCRRASARKRSNAPGSKSGEWRSGSRSSSVRLPTSRPCRIAPGSWDTKRRERSTIAYSTGFDEKLLESSGGKPFHVHALDLRGGGTFAKLIEQIQKIVLGTLRVHPHGAVGLVSNRTRESKRDRAGLDE